MSKKHLEQKVRDKAAERDRYMSELFLAEERIQTLEFQCRRIDDRNIELESEINRLRALITAWADADIAWADAPEPWKSDTAQKYTDAVMALRAEVGR